MGQKSILAVPMCACGREEEFLNMLKGKDQSILSASRTNCEKSLLSTVSSFGFAYLCLRKSEICVLKSLKLH